MADRAARRNGLSRRDDGIGIDAVMPVELGERSGLAEVLDAQGAYAMAGDGAKPCEGRRMAVKHADDPPIRRHDAKQPLGYASVRAPDRAHALVAQRSARVEPVGGSDREAG